MNPSIPGNTTRPTVRRGFFRGRRVALLLALAAHGSTARAITVSSDFELDAPVSVPAASAFSNIRSAFNGTDHLVAWVDPSGAVTLTRVSASGVVRDPLGVVLGTAVLGRSLSMTDAPAVASDGVGFLVAWASRAGEVRAARIDASGAVLDPGGFVVTASAAAGAGPVAVGDASGYLVAWRDARNAATTGVDYFASRIGRDGAVRDPAGRPVLVTPGDQGNAALATNGAGWLLACEDGSADLRYGRLDASGAALDGAGRRVAVTVRVRISPSVAWNGTNYLLAWSDQTPSGSLSPGLYAQVIAPSGERVGAEAIALGVGVDTVTTAAPNGSGWLVVGSGSAGSYSTRVSGAGAVLDQPARTYSTPGATGRPMLSGRGAGPYLLTLVARGVNPGALLLAEDGSAAGAPFELSFRANAQQSPNVAFERTGFVVTWLDARVGAEGYRVRRLSAAGAPADAAPTRLPASATPVAVASNRTGTLLAWHQPVSSEIHTFTATYSAAGALGSSVVVDTGGFIGTRYAPVMAAGGDGYLLSWGAWQGSAFNGRLAVRAQPLTATGARIGGAPVGLSGTAFIPSSLPGVSFDGANFLVAWGDILTSDPFTSCATVRAARLTPAGDRLEAANIAPAGVECDVNEATTASDGANHLVVWTATRGVFAARVSPAGVVLDAPPRRISSVDASAPSATFDGVAFVVAWQDARNGSADVYAARVSRSGVVLDPGGAPVAAEPVAEERPKLASAGGGRSLVLYTRRVSTALSRVRGRFVSFEDVAAGDAGAADAAVTDAAFVDAAPTDLGPDAVSSDVTAADVVLAPDVPVADVPRDAGAPDAGAPDAGAPDVAVTVDAGRLDAPAVVDAAPAVGGEGGGCSAGARRRGSPWWALAVAAAALARRRRRSPDPFSAARSPGSPGARGPLPCVP